MEFLNPYRRTGELNSIERLKLARDPLEVAGAVRQRYSKLGASSVEEIDGEMERLKWVGIYPQRQGGDAFMMRIKVPGGRLSAPQASEIGFIADHFGRADQPHPADGACDITTRQDIQLHWVRIEDVPEIWDRLDAVGVTTVEACGDCARNVLCCPVSGVDANELIDAYPLALAISDFFTGNPEYSNLPRKFKISITGCVEDCARAEINDVGLVPARSTRGALGFNLMVGGGLSDGPRLASPLDVFVLPDQVIEICRAVAQTYGELGNRENRGLARMRYLVQELGPEGFRRELASRAAFDLAAGGEDLTRTHRGDHLGVHPQRQQGLSYVGCNVTVGRMAGTDLVEAARLAQTYGDGNIALATEQNLIFTGVPEANLEPLLAEPLLERYSPSPRPFERGAIACTGNEFCRYAVVETKARMAKLARALDDRFAARVGGSVDQVVRIHLSGCSASCAQPQVADIGLRGATAHVEQSIVEALDVGVGGSLGSEAALADWVDTALPVDLAEESLGRLIDDWLENRLASETMHSWARRQPADKVRTVLRAGAAQGRVLP